MKDNELVWTTEDGREYQIKDMDTSHLKNTLNMLKRNGYVSTRTVMHYVGGPLPTGDCAQDAFDLELDEVLSRAPLHCMTAMEFELEKRELKRCLLD